MDAPQACTSEDFIPETVVNQEEITSMSRPSVDHGALSPSGTVSKRTRAASIERARRTLFGDGLEYSEHEQPSEETVLRRQADELLGLANRGMKPRAHRKRASELIEQADKLDAG